MGDFHRIVIMVGTVVVSLSFLLAFSVRTKENTPFYLRRFYLYPLLTLLLSLNTFAVDFFKLTSTAHQASIEKIIFTIDFSFFAYFFISVVEEKSMKQLIKMVSILFLLGTVVSWIFFAETKLYHYYFRAYHNLGKLIFCLIYLYSIFNCSPKLILKKEPAFWITSGLLFYTTVTIPIFLSYYYLAINRQISILSILFPLTNISIILMHLLFIKGYLCTIQQRKTY
jgi:hypothetical protein